jgi:ATP-dependent DNA ligase
VLDQRRVRSGGHRVDKKTGSPIALLAEDKPDGLRFAGGAFITLRGHMRERFSEKLTGLAAARPPPPGRRRREAQWIRPKLVVGVRHLRGNGALRHATVHELRDD